ncbi:TetR/AcrR family transcriptional regulator [Sphingobacterium chungjuense]|uniref:TetR/AcrR family transcriptional regulator n=1 Tax=Sphingobacterium chungjuense TaxID=2675553 RepID=UPI00140D5C7C|nr:TetR/AcrR family transcriptional regulator [Sphingobacterium chungjuense]
MRHKDFNEEEVLRKAIQIFWEKGYYATSMHDLIDTLGIGRSSIYHAYGDKHSLFIKALELYQIDGTARLINIIESAPSVKTGIKNLLDTVISDIFENRFPAGCFKVNSEVELANHDTDIQKLLYDDDLILETALYEAIKGGQVNQEIDKAKDALATARFFMNTVAGMRVYAKFRKDRKLFEDIAKTALSVIE